MKAPRSMGTKSLKGKVEHILKTQPHTANSDIELTLWVWYSFFQALLEWEVVPSMDQGGRWIVPLSNVRKLPSEDKISRIRRKFQEEGLYPATDPTVIARREKEENIRSTINTADWDQHL